MRKGEIHILPKIWKEINSIHIIIFVCVLINITVYSKKKNIYHIINSYDIEIIKITSLIVIPLRSKFSFVNFFLKKKSLKRCLRILFNLQKNLFIYFSILTLKSSHITSEIVREGGV